MNRNAKNTIGAIIGVIGAAVALVMILLNPVKHIEDTNGPDNYALTTISEEELLEPGGSCTGLGKKTSGLFGTTTFSSGKFTGVYDVMWTDVLFTTNLTINLADFQVNGGNFRMVVINEGEIIADVEPVGSQLVELGQVSGDVRLVIAGESADFSFTLFTHEYESYAHYD